MKSPEDFLAYYQKEVAPGFVRFNKPKGKINWGLIIAIVYFLFVVILCATRPDIGFFFAFFGVGGIVWYNKFTGYGKGAEPVNIVSGLKVRIISEILRYYAPGLTYSPYSGMLDKTIEISNLFDGYSYVTIDSIEGKVDNTYIQMCSLCTTETNKMGEYVFAGIYMLASFNKSFKGQYTVFSGFHFAPSVYQPGNNGPLKLTPIKLENPEFNRRFSCYGTDNGVEARYLLTPALMQKMVDAVKETGDKIHVAFARNHIFFAISTGTPPFGDEISSATDSKVIERWNRIIRLSLSMVEEFNLDEHLWSKQ